MELNDKTRQKILDVVKDDYKAYGKVSDIIEKAEQSQNKATEKMKEELKADRSRKAKEQTSYKEIAKSNRIVKR